MTAFTNGHAAYRFVHADPSNQRQLLSKFVRTCGSESLQVSGSCVRNPTRPRRRNPSSIYPQCASSPPLSERWACSLFGRMTRIGHWRLHPPTGILRTLFSDQSSQFSNRPAPPAMPVRIGRVECCEVVASSLLLPGRLFGWSVSNWCFSRFRACDRGGWRAKRSARFATNPVDGLEFGSGMPGTRLARHRQRWITHGWFNRRVEHRRMNEFFRNSARHEVGRFPSPVTNPRQSDGSDARV